MTTNSLRVGIIGTGNTGRRHARAYGYHKPRTHLVACCDLLPESARQFSEQFGCEREVSVDSLLSRLDVDAVSICTTEPAHLEPVLKAAAAGKHILVEKPMAPDLEQALAMQSAVQASGVKLMVGHLFRFDLRCAGVKEAVDTGRVGRVRSIDARIHGTPPQQDRIKSYELPVILFRGCHAIDLMRWYTSSEVVRVYAESVDGMLRKSGYHSEDATFCLMRFGNGAVGSLEVNSHVPVGHPSAGKSELTIIGTSGMANIDLAMPWFTLASDEGLTYESGDQKDLWFREQIDAFARFVLDDAPSIATIDDAIAALKVSLAAVASARAHRPVEIG